MDFLTYRALTEERHLPWFPEESSPWASTSSTSQGESGQSSGSTGKRDRVAKEGSDEANSKGRQTECKTPPTQSHGGGSSSTAGGQGSHSKAHGELESLAPSEGHAQAVDSDELIKTQWVGQDAAAAQQRAAAFQMSDILAVLGSGAEGNVYLARYRDLPTCIAFRTLRGHQYAPLL